MTQNNELNLTALKSGFRYTAEAMAACADSMILYGEDKGLDTSGIDKELADKAHTLIRLEKSEMDLAVSIATSMRLITPLEALGVEIPEYPHGGFGNSMYWPHHVNCARQFLLDNPHVEPAEPDYEVGDEPEDD